MHKSHIRPLFGLRLFLGLRQVAGRLFRKMALLFSASIEQRTFGYGDFREAQRSAYYRSLAQGVDTSIDDQTWKDLMMEEMLEQCTAHSSIHGIQMTYATLRAGGGAQLHRGHTAAWLSLGVKARPHLDKLRSARSEVATALFGSEVLYLPLWAKRIHLIPWIEGVLLLAAVYLQWWPAAFGVLALSLLTHGSIQIRLYAHLIAWRDLQRELIRLLDCATSIRKEFDDDRLVGFQEALPIARIGEIRRDIGPSLWEAVPGFSEYADLLFLHSFARLDKARARLAIHAHDLRATFQHLASIEMHCSIARFRAGHQNACDVQPPRTARLLLQDAVNPLVCRGSPFSVKIDGNGAIVTGKNGVGKSTLLRGIGLNLALSRSFGFCLASVAELPELTPWSSIQNEDSLALGESLYMAEMRRANELILASRAGKCAFLVDELFRGTNNTESVSAATAVLEELARNNVVVASSHNVVLTSILRPSFSALVLRRRHDGSTMSLELVSGVEHETNGIEMMSKFLLPDAVVRRAEFIAEWYLRTMTESGSVVGTPGAIHE